MTRRELFRVPLAAFGLPAAAIDSPPMASVGKVVTLVPIGIELKGYVDPDAWRRNLQEMLDEVGFERTSWG